MCMVGSLRDEVDNGGLRATIPRGSTHAGDSGHNVRPSSPRRIERRRRGPETDAVGRTPAAGAQALVVARRRSRAERPAAIGTTWLALARPKSGMLPYMVS